MAMPQVDWESIKSFVQIPLSWFKEVSRRSNLFSKHPLIVIDRNNPDGVGIGIDATQLPKGGGGGGGNFGAFQYDAETRVVGEGVIALARTFLFVYGTITIPNDFTGFVIVHAIHSTASSSARVELQLKAQNVYVSSFGNSNDEYTDIPLYSFDGGELYHDFRCSCMIPLWE